MKRLLFTLLLLPAFVYGQIITTFAGNGIVGFSGDGGPADFASIGEPDGCAFDALGNLYFTTVVNNRVRKVTPLGMVSTFAGTTTSVYNGDSIAATTAGLSDPFGIAVDRYNNVYIADNFRVRKVDAVTGIISTVAGNGTGGFGGDGGPATNAMLNGVEDICFDQSGNLYIADDPNFRIRKVSASGIITTYAGNGVPSYSGDGGSATAAAIGEISGICTDRNGNLYMADGSRVRMVNTMGKITTIAGNGLVGPNTDDVPAIATTICAWRLAFDNARNHLFVSGLACSLIREIDNLGIIHTVAGNGTNGFSGDGGQAASAETSNIYGIALDSCGNLYLADKDNVRIRKVAFNPTCIPAKVNNIVLDKNLTIYPNPTAAVLTINFNDKINCVAISNLMGQIVYSNHYNSQQVQIDVADLPAGIYFVRVNGTEVRKFVKQ